MIFEEKVKKKQVYEIQMHEITPSTFIAIYAL